MVIFNKGNRGKLKLVIKKIFSACVCFALLFSYSHPAYSAAFNNRLDQFDKCNWLVTYRGKTYDLAPLSREALARPIENDLRYALQRVPEAEEHLIAMQKNQRDARGHTVLATTFLTGLLVSRVLASNKKSESQKDQRLQLDIISAASGLFFLKATYESWRSTRNAKEELLKSVDAFNEYSTYKIEPASNGDALGGNNAKTK